MEALTATAMPSPSSPLSVFSPAKSHPPLRSVSLRNMIPLVSKGGVNEPDRRSDADEFENGLIIGGHGLSFSPFSKDAAMGLVLSAAAGRGWTTGSGMEGPAEPLGPSEFGTSRISTFPWSLFTKSPRRRMLIAFTCNICTQRTTRAINPHAYTDGTVFVQCCGCNAYHKLVDNLNLFTDMKCYIDPSFNQGDQAKLSFEYQDMDDGEDDLFRL